LLPLPVLPEDLGIPAVMPAAVAEELGWMPGSRLAGLLERLLRCLVLDERSRADLVEVQLAKQKAVRRAMASEGVEFHHLIKAAALPENLAQSLLFPHLAQR
jgi:hypothetical protein